MASSILTNSQTMTALQSLNRTTSEIARTREAVATGREVVGTKDDGARYAVAQGMRADVAAFGVVATSLNRALAIGDTALGVTEIIADILSEMRGLALRAVDPSIDAQTRETLDQQFQDLKWETHHWAHRAEFDGVNILNASQPPSGIAFPASDDGASRVVLNTHDLVNSGILVPGTYYNGLTNLSDAETALNNVNLSMENISEVMAQIGADIRKIEGHQKFISKLSDSLETGIGALIDADLAKEAARLRALEVKQELGVQALGIANSSPELVLSLFEPRQ